MFDNRRFFGVAFVLLAVAVTGCVVTPAQPLTDAGHEFGQSEDEKKLIRRSSELDDELRRKGLLLQDEQVNSYVNEVGKRVVPTAARGAVPFQVHVLRDPVVNAFALPNGSIYLTVGLLARLENEAQLAHVVSHETAHVVQRHGLLGLRNRKATIIAAHIADLALFGTSIAYLPALGNLAAYSQESESEADRLALQYMAQAGYPLAGADRLFVVLGEVNRQESIWGSAYSSHPDNNDRANSARAIIASVSVLNNAGGRVDDSQYRQIRQRVSVENLQLKLNIRQYELAVVAAERALAQAPGSPWLHYYRGEAYRLMAEDPEGAAREHAWIHDKKNDGTLVDEYRRRSPESFAIARDAYQEALAVDREFVLAYRGLGLVAFAEGNHRTARQALGRYLASGRDVGDRRYINHIMGRLAAP